MQKGRLEGQNKTYIKQEKLQKNAHEVEGTRTMAKKKKM